ncbi:hypothetical protein RS022_09260 [Candidatus Phytoplasma rubi]|uniref:Uncharacterized protein n=1 Tax=Candidatus Phytoplasma rubi TaxID=399025 RepID=A0ABY7BTU9_9MOLU|nr:hypothetical protein RS022_09260 [Candidatus Phytoplasma rubi]
MNKIQKKVTNSKKNVTKIQKKVNKFFLKNFFSSFLTNK